MPNEPTAWELDRRFDRLDKTLEAGFRHIGARLDKMVTVDVFTVSQRSTEQRLASFESAVTAVESRCKDNRMYLQNEIDQVENRIDHVEDARAADRRMMVKAMVGAGATIAGTVLAFILSIIPGGISP